MDDHADLQLERAEFEGAPQTACAVCSQSLRSAYFQVNDRVVCEFCCDDLRASLTGGSRWGRAAKAFAAGAAAALAGSIVYYAILALTGYEFGLIAIVVGVAVGRAVRWGSGARGGWPYQSLAVILTYLSIVSAYVPMIVSELIKLDGARSAAVTDTQKDAVAVTASEKEQTPANAGLSLGGFVLALIVLLGLACAMPFLAGMKNIIGLIIIGIGVYEAWKVNRRTTMTITGPHAIVPSRIGT